ncbi:MAG: carboxypeptidase-like regulatory domain-containing protein [Anaerolineae bacterium]|nr:carboxypeptidase-like regulatory domain-containing protein [Anaerolineae bacterium]MDW8102364.1 carboxypeptidase-like regulatory domain-containing protein [Anaerolineae bacterium]
MKRIAFFLFLSGFLVVSLALAQGSGTVEGDVTNGSREGKPVPGITVTLHVFDSRGIGKASFTTVTDQEGRFSFKGLDTNKGLFYVTAVNFEGIVYRSPALSFTEGQQKLHLPVLVYEATERDTDVSIQKAHFIFNVDLDAGIVLVMEMYLVANNGLKTLAAGEEGSLRFPLPSGVQDFSSDTLRFEAGKAIYTLPVYPGPMPQPIVLEYSLPVQGDFFEVRRPVLYPVESYNILVTDVGLSVEVVGARMAGRIRREGKEFLNYSGEKLPKNGEISVKFAGFTKAKRIGDFGGTAAIVFAVALALLGLLLLYIRKR